ncbi:unnamed protein product [Toxocara canis]|nr:unnamed protein product [Toxocara canis]
MKVIDKRKDFKYSKRCLPRELQIVQKIDHNNIVRVYEIIEKEPFVCLVQEYAEKGDLLKRIRQTGRVIEPESRIFFRQILEALMYLKSIEVVHRDLKCENVLLDTCLNVKLADFGFARFMKPGDRSKTFCGSRAYLSPEIIRGRPYDGFLADIWSGGIVLYVMITGCMPYNDRNVRKMLEKQLQHRISFPRSILLSNEVKQLIFEILHPIPTKRPSLSEIVHSKWLINTEYRMRVAKPRSDSSSSSESNKPLKPESLPVNSPRT